MKFAAIVVAFASTLVMAAPAEEAKAEAKAESNVEPKVVESQPELYHGGGPFHEGPFHEGPFHGEPWRNDQTAYGANLETEMQRPQQLPGIRSRLRRIRPQVHPRRLLLEIRPALQYKRVECPEYYAAPPRGGY
ncbi:hypothetical protein E4U21_006906 [Claviceps maximensis]|nr:hypothetical protein E4U21_006906 [Claviceps maximensis]